VLGVPALFDREVFDELLALEGDAGARVVIRKSEPTRIAAVKAPEAAFDVDTPADHQRLKELESGLPT
jgi:molybdenum cofactor cytidylyltransferase